MKLFLVSLCVIFFSHTSAQKSDFKTVDFQKADSVASYYKGHDLTNLPVLSYKLSSPLTTDVEKFRAIHSWVSNNIANDVEDYRINKKKREKFHDDPAALQEWNEKFREKVFAKLLKEKKTICTGYAYLIAELSGMAGISAQIIDGYGRTVTTSLEGKPIPNHSWNAVKLEGKWYLCDATWSSGGISLEKREFMPGYNDGYFLAEPGLFALNHYPVDTAWLLTDPKISFEDFMNSPLVYKYAFSNQIKPVQPTGMNIRLSQGKPVEFVFELGNAAVADQISIEINRGNYVKVMEPILEKVGQRYNFSFQPGLKGKFDLHVKVGEEYVISYNVEAKRK